MLIQIYSVLICSFIDLQGEVWHYHE